MADIGQQIDKWLTAKRKTRGKKQNASSKYKKIDLTPEAAAVYADENAKKNNTSVAKEKALNQRAIDRDNAIEEATYLKEQPLTNMINEGGLVTGGGTPQVNPVIPQAKTVSAAAAPLDAKINEEMAKANENQKVIDEASKEGETNTNGNDSKTGEGTNSGQSNPPVSEAEKNYYNKAAMSIWDAYFAGKFGKPGSKEAKNTATYFTIDALANAAKNMGRSIGNVGAQFTGGAIDNGQNESDWSKRRDAILDEEIQKEREGVGSAASRQAESEKLDIEAKKIRNAYTPAQLENQLAMFQKELEMADINLDMAHSKTDLINFIKKDPNYAKSPFKMALVSYLTQAGTAGATQDASKTLSDAMNWILTIAK